jgi:hypothetical protein
MSKTLKILIIKGSLDLGQDLNLTALQIDLKILICHLDVTIVTFLGMYRGNVEKGVMTWLGVGIFLILIKLTSNAGSLSRIKGHPLGVDLKTIIFLVTMIIDNLMEIGIGRQTGVISLHITSEISTITNIRVTILLVKGKTKGPHT